MKNFRAQFFVLLCACSMFDTFLVGMIARKTDRSQSSSNFLGLSNLFGSNKDGKNPQKSVAHQSEISKSASDMSLNPDNTVANSTHDASKPASPTSSQDLIQPTMHQVAKGNEKLAGQSIQSYIAFNKVGLKQQVPKVSLIIIDEIAPIYTIGLINQRASRLTGGELLGFNKVELTEMRFKQDDWMINKPNNLQKIDAGLDALNSMPPQQELKNSYFSSGKTMQDYVEELQKQFPGRSPELLKKYATAVLIQKQSGQPGWFSNHKTLTPQEVAKNPGWQIDRDLGLPSQTQKIYAMLQGLDAIIKENEALQAPSSLALPRQTITAVANTAQQAVNVAQQVYEIGTQLYEDPANTVIKYVVPQITNSLASQSTTRTPLNAESINVLEDLTQQVTGHKIDLNQPAEEIIHQATNIAVQEGANTLTSALKASADPNAKPLLNPETQQAVNETLNVGLQQVLKATDVALQTPTDPHAKPLIKPETEQAASKVIKTFTKNLLGESEQDTSNVPTNPQSAKIANPNALKFSSKDGNINGTITPAMRKNLNVPTKLKSRNDVQNSSITSSNITDFIYNNVVQPAMQSIKKTPENLREIGFKIVSTARWLVGYGPMTKIEIENLMNEENSEINDITQETDPAKQNERIKSWTGKLINKVCELTGQDKLADIHTLQILGKANDPLSPTVRITYNAENQKIKSAQLTYAGKTYSIDPTNIIKNKNSSQYTITAPLYNNPKVDLSFGLLKKTVKETGDSVGKNLQYADPETQNLVKSIIDYVYPKLTDPAANGQISIVFDPTMPNNVQQTITQILDNSSAITTKLEFNQNKITKKQIQLYGKKGNIFAPEINMEFDAQGNLSAVDLKHTNVFNNKDSIPQNQTIEFDRKRGLYIITADFVEPAPTENQINALTTAWQNFASKAGTALEQATVNGMFNTYGIQQLKNIDPTLGNVLDQIKNFIQASISTSIESVVVTYNPETHEVTTATTTTMSKGQPVTNRLKYSLANPYEQAGKTSPTAAAA